ncbi:MAG: nickel pincer cofactor biosynthesis protein LarC [Blastocatellia bacterium]|nr:nickel pincer cofactor biosynthesis protein LarC [Blastocatellia bacterium]
MKTLYFDCFAGISGDMTIGALLALGVDFNALREELRKLNLDGYELSVRETTRAHLSCLKFDVTIEGKLQQPLPLDRTETQHHQHDHGHHHDHDHGHHHDHHPHDSDSHLSPQPSVLSPETAPQSSALSPDNSPHSHPHRTVTDIRAIIAASRLSPWVKTTAAKIFWRLAEAESIVHGIPPQAVHFHEVGAVDAIIDIVGACIGFEMLGIEHFVASPLNVGFGFIKCAHGKYPIPAPGTAELLKGVPYYSLDIEGEFTTPTGAAIVTTLCQQFTRSPGIVSEKIGYGAGGRDFANFPNALRLVLGQTETAVERQKTKREADLVTVIEANIDDMNPQIYGHVMDRLFANGALDVFYTPIQMKKNRPGTLLSVLCEPDRMASLSYVLFQETTTLGVRYREMHRFTLGRKLVPVETEFGTVRVKTGILDGDTIKIMPEFEDCHRLALTAGVSLSEVQAAAVIAFHKKV